jgi:hypothetical protein
LVDNFLEEVEERVRSDRYQSMLRRAVPWAIGALLVIALALGGWFGWKAWNESRMTKASETYAAALESAAGGDSAGAFAKFDETIKAGPAAYKASALMHQAGLRLGEGKTQEAVALFDKAAEADKDPMIADVARLKSALALMDTAPYAVIETRLKPLLDEKRPYRIAAREALAMAKLKAGKYAEARSDFGLLTLAPDVPDSMRQRAQAAITLIDGGTAGSLAVSLKAKPAMPQAPTLPGQPGPGLPGQVQPGAPAAQPGAPR